MVRREAPADVPGVRALTGLAFSGLPDNAEREVPVEVSLLDALRDCEGWIPALSLVALDQPDQPDQPDQRRIVGHVVCTRGHIDDAPALGLGPISVHPDRQGEGVGSTLVHAVLAAAEAREETVVALLGAPSFYARFGFRPSAEHQITAPEATWGAYFQTRQLAAPGRVPRGRFSYAGPFQEL